MARLWFKATVKYKEYGRRLKEQFINGLEDENIIEEIIRELIVLNVISEVSSIFVGPESGGAESTKGGNGQYQACKRV